MNFLKYSLFCSVVAVGLLQAGDAKIIAAWNFTDGSAVKGKYALKPRGESRIDNQGLHAVSGGLRQPAGAVLNGRFPELSPRNAFEVSAEIVLADSFKRTAAWSMICDSKYVAMPRNSSGKNFHRGWMFFLVSRGNGRYRLGGAFGYGKSSAQAFSRDIVIAPGKICRVGMRFDAIGNVTFLYDGKVVSRAAVPAGSIAPGDVNITFADRTAANHQPLGGVLRSLEIRQAEFTPQAFVSDPVHRKVFERGEKNADLYITLQNFLPEKLTGDIIVKASSAGKSFAPVRLAKPEANSRHPLRYPVDTLLLPGEYTLELSAADNTGKIIAGHQEKYTIVPAYGDFLPVMLWGNWDDFKLIRKYGFTHQIVHFFPRQGDFNPVALKQWIPHLDGNLKEKLYTFGTLHSHHRFLQARRYLRTGRDGKPYARLNLEASHPEVQKEFASAAFSTAKAFADHPAFDGALINSEVRDGAFPSYGSGVEPEAFRKFSGFDIPESISGKSPKPYQGDPAFPWDRVIPDHWKDLLFLRWYWDRGDGWNPLQSLLSDTIHRAVRGKAHKERFFTFYDPVTRVPPLWGSGGSVDMISQWTYTYPDPLKIGQTTDEVIAMAQGNPRQKIASMTQAIWYRSQTAPIGKKVKNPPEWLKEEPQAPFISIAPDSLREAFWIKISRRLDAIMYHGVGSLLTKTDHKLYRMTNLQSREVLRELNREVILPLGPVLKRVPEYPFEVAILESFAASQYAPKHFPLGWGRGWTADLHLALQWGHFQPGIIYDEHLMTGKAIGNLKVLFVPGLEVITQPVLEKLNALRKKGVIIIGDEFTLPALMVDYRLQSVQRNTNDPAGSKKALQALGKKLAQLLDQYGLRRATASNQDLIVRRRGVRNADYLFVANDKRTRGDYIGQWGLAEEKGLPNRGEVTSHYPAKAVYDLVKHTQIPFRKTEEGTRIGVDLAPGGGALFLLLDREISKLSLAIPESVKRGAEYVVSAAVSDSAGTPVDAILPVELTLISSDGKILPGSGYYAAENGKLTVREIMATNAAPGKAEAVFRCLASGKTIRKVFTIAR